MADLAAALELARRRTGRARGRGAVRAVRSVPVACVRPCRAARVAAVHVGGAGVGRRAGEAVALVVVDQLVVGLAALVHAGALLVQLGLRALALGLLLGHARLALGLVGLALAALGLLAMLGRRPRRGAARARARASGHEPSRASAAAARAAR